MVFKVDWEPITTNWSDQVAKKLSEAEYIRKFERRTEFNRRKKRKGGTRGKLVKGHFVSANLARATDNSHEPGAWGSFLVTKRT